MAVSLLCSAAYLDRRREQQKTGCLVDLFLIKFLLTGGPLLASQITGMIMTFFQQELNQDVFMQCDGIQAVEC